MHRLAAGLPASTGYAGWAFGATSFCCDCRPGAVQERLKGRRCALGDEQVDLTQIIKDALMAALPEDTPSDVICKAVRAVLAALKQREQLRD